LGNKAEYKRIAKNSVFLYVLTFSNYFMGLLIYPYLSRVLNIDNFGLIGFSMSYATVFQVIIEFGFMISATAQISKYRTDTQRTSEIISNIIYAKFLLSVVSLVVFFFVALIIPTVRNHLLIVFLFYLNGIFIAFVPDFYFRGIEQMRTIAIRSVLTRAVSYALILIFVKSDYDILLIPIFLSFGNFITLVISFIMIFKSNIKFVSCNPRASINIIKDSFFFFLSRFAVSINSSLGSFVLGLAYSPVSLEVGFFAGCSKLSSACEMMLSPVSDSVYPHMVNKKDYKLFKKVFIYGTILWFAAMVLAFFMADMICVIILGPEYSNAGKYLRILLIGPFLWLSKPNAGLPCTFTYW